MIENDRIGCQACLRSGQNVIDDRVVLENEVNARSATHCLGGRCRSDDAKLPEREDLVRRAVPRRDGIAASGGSLCKGTAEQTGAEKREL